MSKKNRNTERSVEILTKERSVLNEVVNAILPTEPDRARVLISALVDQALQGGMVFDRNLSVTINAAIKRLDEILSLQLCEIFHTEEFGTLEGSWRGLHHLVKNTETSVDLKIKVLCVTKNELKRDFDKAVEFDQTFMFRSVYEGEFGTAGGEPFAALVGNFDFNNSHSDIQLLRGISSVAAASFAPFITAASPRLFGFNDYRDLSRPRDLERIFQTQEYASWRSWRETDDARFVVLSMPRVLARLPYGSASLAVDEFDFNEAINGDRQPLDHENYCWMNTAFVMAEKLTDAYARSGWCTSIRGAENGGKVENLPLHVFMSDDGDPDQKCPTEVGITDRRDAELSKLGFLPLCHYKNTDFGVFFGGQSAHRPKRYDRPEATANAIVSARLPYIMATSRFAHYIKVMARDKIGSFMEAKDCEAWLNRWISNYVNSSDTAGEQMRASYPLREAKVTVEEVPGQPGTYNAITWLRPWLQMEELTTSLRLVARIPGNTERGQSG
ncbi:MAG: type VI secretion system contractile sheath large subunit [Brucella intermedia]